MVIAKSKIFCSSAVNGSIVGGLKLAGGCLTLAEFSLTTGWLIDIFGCAPDFSPDHAPRFASVSTPVSAPVFAPVSAPVFTSDCAPDCAFDFSLL